jgi:GntR family transcriptional repressor for pyruvate dehydrogenase complex
MVSRLSDNKVLPSMPHLPEQIAAVIGRQIKDGLYLPGTKLPPESRLSQTFGVSRSVVREAMSRLKTEGLVDSRQGKGVMVLDPAARTSFRMEAIDRLSQPNLAQFYEMRAVIESETASLAARRRRPKDLNRLRDCLARMARSVEERTDGTQPDVEFHQLIAAASANRYLQDLMEYLNSKVGTVIRAAREHSSRSSNLPRQVQKEHESIFAAISAGDAGQARASSRQHLMNAARRLGIRTLGV